MATKKYVCDNCESELTPKERKTHACARIARVLIGPNQCPGCYEQFRSSDEMLAHNCPATSLKSFDNEMLLQLYVGSLSLARLHAERGGMNQSRNYYTERATKIRSEIILRMSK